VDFNPRNRALATEAPEESVTLPRITPRPLGPTEWTRRPKPATAREAKPNALNSFSFPSLQVLAVTISPGLEERQASASCTTRGRARGVDPVIEDDFIHFSSNLAGAGQRRPTGEQILKEIDGGTSYMDVIRRHQPQA
jgi:hypothetical protein